MSELSYANEGNLGFTWNRCRCACADDATHANTKRTLRFARPPRVTTRCILSRRAPRATPPTM